MMTLDEQVQLQKALRGLEFMAYAAGMRDKTDHTAALLHKLAQLLQDGEFETARSVIWYEFLPDETE